MADRPILFSGAMVRALLDGSKTQTRRVVKPQPPTGLDRSAFVIESTDRRQTGSFCWSDAFPLSTKTHHARCPFGVPGDRLWVRETMKLSDAGWYYAADGAVPPYDGKTAHVASWWAELKRGNTCVSIHMPRWASRITLEVTSVRVARLQAISEEDANAEGVEAESADQTILYRDYRAPAAWFQCWREDSDVGEYVDMEQIARASYRTLWESINGPGSWLTNPWVWVVEFKRAEVTGG